MKERGEREREVGVLVVVLNSIGNMFHAEE
jgi:hypothetical protein